MTQTHAPYHAHIYYEPANRHLAETARSVLHQRMVSGDLSLCFVGSLRDGKAGPHPLPQFEIQFVVAGLPAVREFIRARGLRELNPPMTDDGQANYAAAKAGMHGFTISLAQENAKFGITVHTVSPGYVATDMVMAVPEEVREKIVAQIPIGRLGKPEEIAHAVAFFTTDEASWITGANLAINGGHYMGW